MAKRLLIIFLVALPVLVWAWLDGPAARQRRGMDAARAFSEQLAPKLAADPRFKTIRLGVMTHPSLVVSGEIADEKALDDLRALVTPPPAATYRLLFHVRLSSASTNARTTTRSGESDGKIQP